ncbi:GntR family transcriptional regulator [bacterium]|nr:GntR family transcriptional regulator [bacterium]
MAKLLYQSVYDDLKYRIVTGTYPPGTALPSETGLKNEFHVSSITVRRAIQELVFDGLVEKRHGIGSFVRDKSRETEVIGLSSFTTDVAAGRLRIVRTLLVDDMVPARKDIAEKLGVQPDSMLRHLVRLDTIGGSPFSLDEVYISPVPGSFISRDIADSPLFMHLLQEKAGLCFVRTEYDIRVHKAGQREKEFLGVDESSPLLITGELIFDASDHPVLWIVSTYPAYRCRLNGTVKLVQRSTPCGTIGE